LNPGDDYWPVLKICKARFSYPAKESMIKMQMMLAGPQYVLHLCKAMPDFCIGGCVVILQVPQVLIVLQVLLKRGLLGVVSKKILGYSEYLEDLEL
jgi:hypothetical protein